MQPSEKIAYNHTYQSHNKTEPVSLLRLPCSETDQPCDHSREGTISFTLDPEKLPSTLHGFAAYFESVLYKDVTISTVPGTHTPKMLSWFPMFFPLAQPVRLEPGSQVSVSMWRLSSPSQVCICSSDPEKQSSKPVDDRLPLAMYSRFLSTPCCM